MKKTFFLLGLGIVFNAHAQVGINTSSPTVTLDIAGKPDDANILDGVIPPRLSGNQLAQKTYSIHQTGALLYVESAASSLTGQVVNVNSPGYYYFDGSVWVILKSTGSNVTNSLLSNVNTLTSNVSGLLSQASIINSTTLSNPTANTNTIRSTINGVESTTDATIISSNVLTNPSTNTIRSTINGVASTTDATIISSVSNTSSLANNTISTTVNDVAGATVSVPNLYTTSGTLGGSRVVTEGANTLTFSGSATGANKFVNTVGTSTAQVAPIQIQDGGQAAGKFLMSDATGNATWKDVLITRKFGVMGPATRATTLVDSPAVNLGAYITLPPGKWDVEANILLDLGNALNDSYSWIKLTFSDSAALTTISSSLTGTSKLISGGLFTQNLTTGSNGNANPFYGIINGRVEVTNSTSADKTYYLVFYESEYKGVQRTILGLGSSFYRENYIVAQKIQ